MYQPRRSSHTKCPKLSVDESVLKALIMTRLLKTGLRVSRGKTFKFLYYDSTAISESVAFSDAFSDSKAMGKNSTVPKRKQPNATRNGIPIQKFPSFIPHLKVTAMTGEAERRPPCSTKKLFVNYLYHEFPSNNVLVITY